ncbi:uncharacterized protein [Parasteatoda tepidariorum]|uniref:uncharacterized protein n=1 Tax=Parasteatoda tepidariorum TaxID=114398 RepID=UPI00077FE35C|nr:uncharacterized protein LOC107438427 [Parasteatoda tepidariorum]
MSDNDSTLFTDEEIYKELHELGIHDVSKETFEKMKQDLIDMVVSSEISGSHEEIKNYTTPETDSISLNSLKRSLFHDPSPNENSFSNSSYVADLQSKAIANKNIRHTLKSSKIYSSSTDVSISTNDLPLRTRNLPNIYENYETYHTVSENKSREQFSSEEDRVRMGYKFLPSGEEISCKSLPQLGGISQTNKSLHTRSPISKPKNERLPEVQKSLEISSEMDSLQIDDSPKMESILGDYRKRLINYKLGNRLRQKIIKTAESDSDHDALSKNETSLNSTVVDGKLKRKILRYKDGKPVVTEELVDIPSIFSSCYPSSLSTTNSYSDLSFKSNSSSGSIVAVSPESTPRSTLSNTSKTHALKPPRKKKSDPVAMYNYYKKFWDNFKPPGEKSHQKLRWAVRDKMLEYS